MRSAGESFIWFQFEAEASSVAHVWFPSLYMDRSVSVPHGALPLAQHSWGQQAPEGTAEHWFQGTCSPRWPTVGIS